MENEFKLSVTKDRNAKLGTNLGAWEEGEGITGICEYLGVHSSIFQKFLG